MGCMASLKSKFVIFFPRGCEGGVVTCCQGNVEEIDAVAIFDARQDPGICGDGFPDM